MMEFALGMGQLSAQLELSRKKTELGRDLTRDEEQEIWSRNLKEAFDAGVNAGVARDMAMVNLHMAQQPPIWIKPAIWAAVAFVLVLVAMVAA